MSCCYAGKSGHRGGDRRENIVSYSDICCMTSGIVFRRHLHCRRTANYRYFFPSCLLLPPEENTSNIPALGCRRTGPERQYGRHPNTSSHRFKSSIAATHFWRKITYHTSHRRLANDKKTALRYVSLMLALSCRYRHPTVQYCSD